MKKKYLRKRHAYTHTHTHTSACDALRLSCAPCWLALHSCVCAQAHSQHSLTLSFRVCICAFQVRPRPLVISLSKSCWNLPIYCICQLDNFIVRCVCVCAHMCEFVSTNCKRCLNIDCLVGKLLAAYLVVSTRWMLWMPAKIKGGYLPAACNNICAWQLFRRELLKSRKFVHTTFTHIYIHACVCLQRWLASHRKCHLPHCLPSFQHTFACKHSSAANKFIYMHLQTLFFILVFFFFQFLSSA